MLLVDQDKHDPDILTVHWMWLPTFIGQNQHLLSQLDHALNTRFHPPLELNEDLLEEIHEFTLDWLSQQVPVKGLREYLASIRMVNESSEGGVNHFIQQSMRALLEPFIDWEALERGEKVVDRRTGFSIQRIKREG